MNVHFNLDIFGGNKLRISDLTQQREEYVDDSVVDKIPLFNYHNNVKYKYSETNTINILQYSTTDTSDNPAVIDIKIDPHDNYLDETYHELDKDGFYIVTHVILPTKDVAMEFLQTEETKKMSYIYYVDNGVVYKVFDGKTEEVTPGMLITVNTHNTNISRCTKKTFSIHFLYECYINACKSLFSKFNTKCGSYSKEDTFNRDFLWMTVNIIKYYIDLKQFDKALSIVEEVNSCSGLCKNKSNNRSGGHGCGCNS